MNEPEEHLKAVYAHRTNYGMGQIIVPHEFAKAADQVRRIRENYNKREAEIRKIESERRRAAK